MTKVRIEAGACGFNAVVCVKKDSGRNLHVTIESECGMLRKMAEDIAMLEFRAPFSVILHNPVYKAASKNLKHASCPVPSAVIKAIEVESGVSLPKKTQIIFMNDDE
jgi:hypothetical protein